MVQQQYEFFIGFDLGDTIMMEESEIKDVDGTTLEAELISGLEDIIRELSLGKVLLGIIADTKIGTYQNVLKQHGLYDLFSVFAISDELGVTKPHPLMFSHASDEAKKLGLSGDRKLMVGNNYKRDIVGAKNLDYSTCWFHWNDRYPEPTVTNEADSIVRTTEELRTFIFDWCDSGGGGR